MQFWLHPPPSPWCLLHCQGPTSLCQYPDCRCSSTYRVCSRTLTHCGNNCHSYETCRWVRKWKVVCDWFVHLCEQFVYCQCIWANNSFLHEAFVLNLLTAAYWSPVNNMKFQHTEGFLILCSDTDVFTCPRELPDERDRVLMCQPDQTWFLSVKTLTCGTWGVHLGCSRVLVHHLWLRLRIENRSSPLYQCNE